MKNLLITGASSGVGMYLSKELSSEYNVIAIARRIEKMEEEFKCFKNIFCYECDISNQIELNKVLGKIKHEHQEISFIINNAGVLKVASIESDIFFEDLNRSIFVNAVAPMKIINYFLPDMKTKNFGRIINITSGAPLNCFPNVGCYSASKAVLNTLTVTKAKELKDFNIKINLMSPGPVKTEMAPDAPMDVSACLETVKYLLNFDKILPDGGFYWLGHKVPLFPNLDGVQWLEGNANGVLEKVL